MDANHKKKYCADVKKVKQWLHSTNERCNSLNHHMKYLKILYQDMPKIQESNQLLSSLDWQNSKVKNSNNDETIISKQMNCNNSLEDYFDSASLNETNNAKQKLESSIPSNLASSLSKINLQHKEEEEEGQQENLNEQKEAEVDLCSIKPRSFIVSQSPRIRSNTLSPRNQQTNMCEEHNHNWQHPYQKHLAEYSAELVENIENSKDTLEQLLLDNQNEYLLRELSSARDGIKLSISNNIKDESTDKNKVCTKSIRREKTIPFGSSSKKGSMSKVDDMVSVKVKKRRRKLHSSNSKSTVTTRDTNYLGKKDAKKRKQKSTK